MDFTVSTRAIVTALYARLPANGSELVLFDLNRSIKFGPLLRSGSDLRPERVLPPPPRRFRTTVMTNADVAQPARWSSGSRRPAPPRSRRGRSG